MDNLSPLYDLLIIGGGINGVGIARDAAGRGLKVLLVEKDDLAQHTSSASTKLIHGGLRYLEYYEFRLVREALQERERLLNIAPHIIRPLNFILPHRNTIRSTWTIRLGLFFYDHLASHPKLPNSKVINLQNSPFGKALRDDIQKGFSYADCAVDDSRLVILNAKSAKQFGADIQTRTHLMHASRSTNYWTAKLYHSQFKRSSIVRAKILINASGPWVADLLQNTLAIQSKMRVRLVKGSHIIVPKLFEGSQAYILQNPDKRIVFAIPYDHNLTLIGTTDIPWKESPNISPSISKEETLYLCHSINDYFKKSITPSDVIWSYSGVRPLYDDASSNASAVTRDYHLDLNEGDGQAPLLSIFGGKITTYRRLAEHAMQELRKYFSYSSSGWTGTEALPGGAIPFKEFETFLDDCRKRFPFLDERTLHRITRAYGTQIFQIFEAANNLDDLGIHFGHGLTQREVDYLLQEEWAMTLEDILWRRTKLGLYLLKSEQGILRRYIKRQQ